jgi:mono/diheme cytochrome c family protein
VCLPVAAALCLLFCGCAAHRQADSRVVLRGKTVFAGSCAGCHTLTGRDSRARGGDLAIVVLSPYAIASFVDVMPVHLARADVDAVAAYVHAEAARAKR